MRSQRLLSCLLLLQADRRLTARELAVTLEVSMRTVYRDVEALCESGVPIHMERGAHGGIVLADGYRRALAQFTSDELQSIFAAGPGPMADLGISAHPQALRKLAGALPAAQRRAAEASRERLLLDHNRWSRGEQPTSILAQLRRACEAERRVRLQYRDRTRVVSDRTLDPLGLVAKAGVWYLIANEAGKGYRTFRVERMVAVEELAESFARPAGFNLEAHWNASVASIENVPETTYDVVVRVRPEGLARLTSFWKSEIVCEDDAATTLRISFPSREFASVQMWWRATCSKSSRRPNCPRRSPRTLARRSRNTALKFRHHRTGPLYVDVGLVRDRE
ncbi:MAG: WYL domain-containing protein [Candidatus Eremiobacteraeota bacterium]|nr:WYL domain-containing protein [Candidatus Eremiobacteraeota bacterium]